MFIEINETTRLAGVYGYPIKHSLSPVMHNTAFRELGMNCIYLPFQVVPDKLEDAVSAIRGLNMKGVNVTIPHKIAIMPFLDEISSDAKAVGAVNTVVNEKGKLVGYNTDTDGFLEPLLPELSKLDSKKVVLFGAGGAARAVVYGLLSRTHHSEIVIVNRTLGNADQLAAEFKRQISNDCSLRTLVSGDPLVNDEIKTAQLVVNSTSIGMMSDESPAATSDVFSEGQIVYDLVYRPLETAFLKRAKESGAVTIGGLEMLIHQGAKSFHLWTNREMPIDSVRWELERQLTDDDGILIADKK